MSSFRTFPAAQAKGGLGVDPRTTCLLLIEFQNEFTTPGGKLHEKVRPNMEATGMLAKTRAAAAELRALGCKVFYAPITFAPDSSDNPNKHLGILAGCDYNKLFVRGTWNAEICDVLAPQEGDVMVQGKRGLSAFHDTTLSEELKTHGIETIALAGFMANCCVESTMRDACEKGFNVITLTDCVATTSVLGWKACTEITYPFFSTPLRVATFLANVRAAAAAATAPPFVMEAKVSDAAPDAHHPKADWTCRAIGEGDAVYRVGPWFVDVRQSTVGEKLTMRSGAHELRRYLTFAEASGVFEAAASGCALCDTIYAKKLPEYAALEASRVCGFIAQGKDKMAVEDDVGPDDIEPFGWFCCMTVVRIPAAKGGGCVLYSPILDRNGTVDGVLKELAEKDLLPVRLVIAPSPQHHLALSAYQERLSNSAVFLCGRASPAMPPLTKKRRDLTFGAEICASQDGRGLAFLRAPSSTTTATIAANVVEAWETLTSICDVTVIDDRRTGEVVMRHRESNVLILSDLLYKSNTKVVGPGGAKNHYTHPEWFAKGQQELFYANPGDNANGLLPSYRTHPRMRSIDLDGTRRSLDIVLGWKISHALACHTDSMSGDEAKQLLRDAWGWVWEEMGLEH